MGPSARRSVLLPCLAPALLLAAGGVRAEQLAGAAADSFMDRQHLSGDWDGRRTALLERGVEFFAEYTAEGWHNAKGGLETGSTYTGLLALGVAVDLERAVGWRGGTLATNALWLTGSDASENLVGNFLTVSNIAGYSTFRLFECWLQQDLLGGKASIRLGQLTADSEFLVSDYSGLFVNGTFGWPAAVYMNLPEGGPGYPMATLGVRFAVEPNDWFGFQGAVFQGNVFPQDVNDHGVRWRLNAATGFTMLYEARVRWISGAGSSGLPGQVKPGLWLQTGDRADPLARETDYTNRGYYVVLEQMLLREGSAPVPAGGDGGPAAFSEDAGAGGSTEQSDQGLAWFLRAAHAPAEHNFITTYVDTGLSYKGLFSARDDDILGIGFGYARLSKGARNALAAEGSSPADAAMVLELTYEARVAPWFTLKPDLQYIVNPGGTRSLDDALVVGVRASIVF